VRAFTLDGFKQVLCAHLRYRCAPFAYAHELCASVFYLSLPPRPRDDTAYGLRQSAATYTCLPAHAAPPLHLSALLHHCRTPTALAYHAGLRVDAYLFAHAVLPRAAHRAAALRHAALSFSLRVMAYTPVTHRLYAWFLYHCTRTRAALRYALHLHAGAACLLNGFARAMALLRRRCWFCAIAFTAALHGLLLRDLPHLRCIRSSLVSACGIFFGITRYLLPLSPRTHNGICALPFYILRSEAARHLPPCHTGSVAKQDMPLNCCGWGGQARRCSVWLNTYLPAYAGSFAGDSHHCIRALRTRTRSLFWFAAHAPRRVYTGMGYLRLPRCATRTACLLVCLHYCTSY